MTEAANDSASNTTRIHVDAGKWLGELPHFWTYIGYDECNWTTSHNGKRLLDKIRDLAERPYYARAHFLFCTGNGLGVPKFGSTNVYTEDEAGNPVYDFRIFDSIFDAWVSRNIRPFLELGFTPLDLVPQTDEPYAAAKGSWAYPPTDYKKWRDLCYEVVRHCLDRYGEGEVSTWYWELWNEPDIFYWNGTEDEYCKLYDYTVDGVKAAFPEARVGGPGTTWRHPEFLDHFLNHVVNGTNYVTGKQGTAINFISFHIKGGNFKPERRPSKQLVSRKQMEAATRTNLEVIDKYSSLEGLEVHLSECDPEGRAAWGMYDNPNLYWRNTEYYASFTASVFKHLLDLNERPGTKVTGALTWAFMFEGKRYFEGVRTLTTNNIDKPILNLFRMLSFMGEKRLALESSGAQDLVQLKDLYGVGASPEIDGLAAMSGNSSVEVMIWNQHDDWDVEGTSTVEVEINHLPFGGDQVRVRHYRIDALHSNAYTEWKRQGSPQDPTETQIRIIHSREGLELLEPDQIIPVLNGLVRKTLELPVHGISLMVITPV